MDLTDGNNTSQGGSDSIMSLGSFSSVQLQFSSDDLIERIESDTDKPVLAEDIRKEGRANKLLKRHNLVIPELNILSKLSDENLDLSQENCDAWLTTKFPSVKMKSRPQKKTVVQSGATALKSVRQSLQASLALKRKQAQLKRKALYAEDNEGILSEQDENEEEEYKPKKKTKLKTPVVDDDEDSANDEDYNGEADASNDESDNCDTGEEESGSDDDVRDIAVLEDVVEHPTSMSINEPEDEIRESVDLFSTPSNSSTELNNARSDANVLLTAAANDSLGTQTDFPNSLSQWFADEKPALDGDDSEEPPRQAVIHVREFDCANATVDDEELMMLCSGRFDDPSQFSLPKPKDTLLKVNSQSSPARETCDSDDDLDGNAVFSTTQRNKKRKTTIDSDDDDEDRDTKDAEDSSKGEQISSNDEETMHTESTPISTSTADAEVEKPVPTRRAVIASDEEDNDDSNDEEEEDEYVGVADNVSEHDGNDSEDELAVMRRLETGEVKVKSSRVKGENFFDDEASLSGDDVGSDMDDDEDENDDYEMEEGDNDVLPDASTIRLQNHRHLMKQEMDKEHRELVKLQDRLLADGDLGGTETNRTFRIRLRDEAEAEADEDAETGGDNKDDVVDVEETEEEMKKRMDAIKFRIQLQESMANAEALADDDEFDDLLSAGAAAMRASAPASRLTLSKASSSLLDKEPLANVFKELPGTVTSKQLYTRTDTAAIAAQKRSTAPAFGQAAKKPKISLLNSIQD